MTALPFDLVIFDWAGTMVDFGCRAPVGALIAAFARRGVDLDEPTVRADMGKAKADHVRALLARPEVAAAWVRANGAASGEADVAVLMADLEPLMRDAAAAASALIPGAAATVAELRRLGIKVASSTGYTREMMADILPAAAAQGYAPDVLVCAGDTADGRPSPLMLWKNLVDLGAWPATACVKVDDAAVGIAEGRGAGVWTIGIAASGNGVGLSAEAFAALPPEDRAARIETARADLTAAGAHLVIDTVADLPEALARLAIG